MTGLFIKATLVIALAMAAHLAPGRWLSASARHLVTTLAILMLLALPVLSLVLPSWSLPVPPVAARAAVQATDDDSADVVPGSAALDAADVAPAVTTVGTAPVTRVPWNVVAVAVYALGVVAMLLQLGVQRWRLHQLAQEAQPVTDPAWLALVDEGARSVGVQRAVRLLRSRTGAMPMTFGTRRPAILLPATADTWDDDRRRAVVLHELAHVARFDCLTQWCACAMRAVYWCHPGAWWLVARVRLDREFACDDLVVATGARPHEYARHLLDIAYTFGGGTAPALAVRMARRSQLEGRLRALLDRTRARHSLSRSAQAASTAGAFALVLPLASAGVPAAVPAVQTTRSAPVLGVAALAPTTALDALMEAPQTASLSDSCTWEISPGKSADTWQLSMRHGRSQSGRSVPASSLEGLTAAQLSSGGPVKFVIRRDAGTFTFEGTARGGVAAGVCSVNLSTTFGPELAKRGISGLTPEDQLEMARHDVSLAFVDELRTQKYATPTTADLVKAGQHGVHLTYLRGMGALGYSTGTLAPLIKLRDHGVTPEYAKALASFGYSKLPVDQLQRARDHGVTPDYVQGMRDAGHGSLTLDQLITARDHGVTPEYGKALAAAGYTNVPFEQLVRVRDHGVSADYVRDMKALGLSGSLEDLVTARDHGVTPDYVRGLGELGYRKLSHDQLRRLRDHGVTPSFVKDIQGVGYTGLTPEDLVTLRNHGLTADRIRKINARAGSQLSVTALRDAAARGGY